MAAELRRFLAVAGREMPENHYITLYFFKLYPHIIPYKIRQEVFASKNRSASSIE